VSPFLKITAGYLHAAFLKNALSSAGARSAEASCTAVYEYGTAVLLGIPARATAAVEDPTTVLGHS